MTSAHRISDTSNFAGAHSTPTSSFDTTYNLTAGTATTTTINYNPTDPTGQCTYSTTTSPINTTTLSTNTDFATLAAQYNVSSETLAALNPQYSIVSILPAGTTLTLPVVNNSGALNTSAGTLNIGTNAQSSLSGTRKTSGSGLTFDTAQVDYIFQA